MTTEEKRIQIIQFSGKTEDWEGWSEECLTIRKQKGHLMLLIGADQSQQGLNRSRI